MESSNGGGLFSRRAKAKTASGLLLIAAHGEAQSGADLVHSPAVQPGYALPKAILRDGDRIMQIDRAGRFHPIVLPQRDLGRYSTDLEVTGATVTVDKYAIALLRVRTTTGLFLSGKAKR